MVVHRGKDLFEHRKLAPRGVRCVYAGIGMHFGRQAYLGCCADDNRVYASIDCQFQHVHGYYDKEPETEQLARHYDMPNTTIAELQERINQSTMSGAISDSRY